MTAFPIFDVKNRLPYFIHLVEGGETVQITRHGKPVARIISEDEAAKEQKTENQIFKDQIMDWRTKPRAWLTNKEIDDVFNIPRTIEPDVRHPEDIEW